MLHSLFEVTDTSRKTLVKNLIELLEKYNLREKIITYVKDERSNLNTMTFTLKTIISCDIVSLE
jgi:hypothetical protein